MILGEGETVSQHRLILPRPKDENTRATFSPNPAWFAWCQSDSYYRVPPPPPPPYAIALACEFTSAGATNTTFFDLCSSFLFLNHV